MTSLVIAEHNNQLLAPNVASAVNAAAQLNDDVHVLVVGESCGQVAQQAAQLDKVTKVLTADGPQFKHQLAEEVAGLVLSIADGYQAIVAPASTMGKNVLPRIGALMDLQPISDVLSIESKNVFTRPMYAGNVIATVETNDEKVLLTIRPTAFEPVAEGASASIESLSPQASEVGLSEFVGEQLAKSDRPDLSSAQVVLSGGRGMQNAENFTLLYNLADKLNAAVGASRAAVDAGFVPNDMQVGQTGKIVAPDLYMAFGISGAIQHLAGMKESKVIVAVNTDEDAPIFQVADYGLVADLFEVLPELTEKLG